MEDILVSMEGNIKPMAQKDREQPDAVDRIVAQWARERPELDTGPMAVIGRLHRLGALLENELRPVFAEAGLGNGDFDVLATLRRAGEPFRLTPGELSTSSMVTSGAVTKRVDRLIAKGLVRRTVSATDGRGREIQLTPEGRALTDELVVRHWANEDRLLAALELDERLQLAGLLRRLLLDVEGAEAGPVDSGV
jgi:DNA-binding MarR family transcriptional regulator